jgi:WD40 repeat protein/DNA-binding SARP family transcriptional activator
MTRLSIHLLGSFRADLNGRPVKDFKSDKVRALLAFLAVEADRPHSRDSLSWLLWPDSPNQAARTNLRSILANLRQVINDSYASPPHLIIDRETVQFNKTSDHWLDVSSLMSLNREFTTGISQPDQLEESITLYQGAFLDGFSLSDSTPFEEWALLKREQISRQVMDVFCLLAAHYEQYGKFDKAEIYTRKLVELEPWNEEAHQQLMRILAVSGKRSAALVQYEACCRLLAKELEVEPSQETTRLYEAIRDGSFEKLVAHPSAEHPAPGAPPYKGLQYFDEQDVSLFFGRELLTAKLVSRLREMLSPNQMEQGARTSRFLAVVGASGSGKSSVARAGLVPAIKRGQKLVDDTFPPEGSTAWQVYILTPTAHPLQSMALSLTKEEQSLTAAVTLMDDFKRDQRCLHLFASGSILSSGRRRFLFIVDQFEELFTVCKDEVERVAFVDNLLNAASTDGPTIVVIVLRADFYAHCARYPQLRQALCDRQEFIGPMGQEELTRAIEEPARYGGWEFEPGLVDLILRDAADEPGMLPLLSHALLETWDRRRGRMLTLQGYEDAGGVRGAIARTADAVYTRMAPEQQTIARWIFLRLTEPGEGAPDSRRRTSLGELISSAGEAGEIEEVLKILADARLITMSTDDAEVAHEALIREWPALREWLNQDRESLRLHRHLTEAALSWEKLGHDSGELYRGVRLAQALKWFEQLENTVALNRLEQDFLRASQESAEQEVAEREVQRQRELEAALALAEVQRQRAEAEARRAEEQAGAARQLRRRSIYLASAMVVALALLVVAVFFAWQEKRQTVIATARELAMAAQGNLAVDPELAILLGLQSASAWASVGQSVPYDLQDTLHRAIPASRARLTWLAGDEAILSVSFIQPGDQPRVITGNRQVGTVTVWNPVSNQALATVSGSVRNGSSGGGSPIIRLSPDGKHLAVPADNNTVKLWDISSGKERCSFSNPSEEVLDTYFSPDGKYLLTIDRLDYIVWEAETCQKQLEILTSSNFSKAAAFSADGKTIAAVTQEGLTSIYEIVSGLEISAIQAGFNLTVLAFSPDGERLAGGGRENFATVWDVATGQAVVTLPINQAFGGQVEAMAYSPDRKSLVIMGSFYKASSGENLYTLLGHTKPVSSLAFNESGTWLITGSYDGTVKLWDLSPEHEVLTLSHPSGWLYGVAFSPDGKWLVTSGEDQTAVVWDALSGEKLWILRGHTDTVNTVAFSPDGNLLATSGADRVVMIWDTHSWQVLRSLVGHGEDRTGIPPIRGIFAVAFSPLCKDAISPCLLAGIGLDGQLIVWDALSGQPQVIYRDLAAGLMSVAFSRDGKQLAVGNASVGGGNSWATIVDAASGQSLRTLPAASGWVWGVDFSPDGRELATINFLGDGKVWDVERGLAQTDLKGVQNGGYSIAFNPDGKLLAAGSNGSVVILDANSGLPLLLLQGHRSLVVRSIFSPDGRTLATASLDGTVRVYVVSPEDLLALARSRLTRSLEPEECQKYLHQETCP